MKKYPASWPAVCIGGSVLLFNVYTWSPMPFINWLIILLAKGIVRPEWGKPKAEASSSDVPDARTAGPEARLSLIERLGRGNLLFLAGCVAATAWMAAYMAFVNPFYRARPWHIFDMVIPGAAGICVLHAMFSRAGYLKPAWVYWATAVPTALAGLILPWLLFGAASFVGDQQSVKLAARALSPVIEYAKGELDRGHTPQTILGPLSKVEGFPHDLDFSADDRRFLIALVGGGDPDGSISLSYDSSGDQWQIHRGLGARPKPIEASPESDEDRSVRLRYFWRRDLKRWDELKLP
ncbi:MAG: hypothetical protein AB1646_08175 [Thermodesulfobacteriota bacterium]